jgi:hypothetical protein
LYINENRKFSIQAVPGYNLVKGNGCFSYRPFANEPVRERVAAFERLRTLSEEPMEQVVQKEPEQTMRVTRTKTRAMVKAAAESASASQQLVTASTEVPRNVS